MPVRYLRPSSRLSHLIIRSDDASAALRVRDDDREQREREIDAFKAKIAEAQKLHDAALAKRKALCMLLSMIVCVLLMLLMLIGCVDGFDPDAPPSKDEVEKMVSEAEAYAEADKEKSGQIGIKNKSDTFS